MQTQISYSDRVSHTGAAKYVLIVARSTFLLHCRDIFSNLNLHNRRGRGGLNCDLTQSQFFSCMHIFYILSVSLTVHFLCIGISSSKIIYIYTKDATYLKGLVIILITWCPPIGWCPRALVQSRLWIIRPWFLRNSCGCNKVVTHRC